MPIVKTNLGREKLSKAHAGERLLPKISHIAFGSGGTVSSLPRNLNGDETQLFNEVIRKPVNLSHPSSYTSRYSAIIDATEDNLDNVIINEAAIFDEEGTMISIKTFKDKTLENGVSFEFYYDAEY